MTQFFHWWRGAKWQSGFTGAMPFPVQVFRERQTWSLIMLLSCSTVNILLRHKDNMTFTIHFTLKHLCFLSLCLSRSLLHGFFASKSSLPWQLGSIYEKSLLSPCFVQYGCFSHLYTRIQNRSFIWWQRLIQVKVRKQGWIVLWLNLWGVWLNTLASK